MSIEPKEDSKFSEHAADVGEVAAEIGIDFGIEAAVEGASSITEGTLDIAGGLLGGLFD